MSVTTPDVKNAQVEGIRFTVASRPQRRQSASYTANNLTAGSFPPIPLPATGFVRKVSLYFTQTATFASTGALITGDAPWNLINSVSLTDATGQPIYQPVTGYNLYLLNKYSPGGVDTSWPNPTFTSNPHMGPEYAHAATPTSGTATWRLDLDFEQDSKTGWGSIPNLDSNASLLLKIDYAAYTNAFTGTTPSNTNISVRVDQWYWAPVGGTTGGLSNATHPIGFGDYVETRVETQTVNAASENIVQLATKGGMIKSIIAVSRNGSARVAFTAGSNLGLVYDNVAIDEGIRLETQQDFIRRSFGYLGADLTNSYAPLTPGVLPGLDTGVIAWPFFFNTPHRDSWVNTRTGSLIQLKMTPGAGATGLELIVQMGQVKDGPAFYIED